MHDSTTEKQIPGVDLTKASVARVYNATLNGKDAYAVDLHVLARILDSAPNQCAVSWANRFWLERVVGYLADQVGIRQFLDLGSGLPTVQNTHEVAQRHNLDSRTVYVDNDPICCAHARALLVNNTSTFFAEADLTKPAELLNNSEITSHIDFSQPLLLMQCGTLHHVPDEADPAAIMAEYIDALPAGSFVAISHFWDPGDEDPVLHFKAREMEHVFTQLGLGSGYYRSRRAIEQMFAGLDLLEPGLVELADWWPPGPPVGARTPEERLILGGVAQKTTRRTSRRLTPVA